MKTTGKNSYVNVITGERISEAEYNALDKFDQSEYDKVVAVNKVKACAHGEEADYEKRS